MENQQDGIAVGSGMNEFQRQNLFEGYPKHTDMTEAIQQGANVDDTSEDQSVQLNDMTITATGSKVPPLPGAGAVRDGTKNQANAPSPTKMKNRETEKVRKVRINNNIDKLLELIPNDQKIKLSKNQILETTYKYLADLKEKCQRYLTMDSESLQQERINDLLAENDRLKKENECFLEIFRTLNIQPNGLLEMNHQLKNVAKKEEKMAQSLLSPTQSFNQNMSLMLSPTGQSCDPSMQSNSQFTGSSLLSPTIVNGNIVLPQTMDSMQRDAVSGISLGNGCMDKKDQEGVVKTDLDSQQGDDIEQVLEEIMEATKSAPLMKSEEEVDPARDADNGVKDSLNNPASISLTSSSQAFVNVSTHQPSITANEAPPKLTSAATTPSTMVTQSLSGPITTTSGAGIVTTAGQNCVLGQPTVSTGMRVTVPPVTTVAASQPNIMLQQQGQTLLLSLPGRAGYIPVKIAPSVQKSSQPVLLPNQGQCGNLAKQLNTTQKRRPLKIKEQGKDSTGQRSAAPTLTLQPQVMQSGLGGPTGPQTMTVRLPVGGGNQHSGGVMFNSAPVVMQQTVQQPVVINTPGGGQQTVLMPVQIQQPVVQQPQQVVYIQQNGQLIPVVVNPPQQQVVSNPVIVNPVQQGQSIQGQANSTGQPVCSTNTTPFTQPTTTVDTTHSEGQTYHQFASNQDGGNSNISNSLQANLVISGQQNKVPNMNANDGMTSVGLTGDPVPEDSLNMERDGLSSMTYPNSQKQVMAANDQHHFEAGVMRPVEQSDDNTDSNDILAQAAEHIFTAGGDDASQQVDSHLGMDSSSAQEENSSHSKRKKKKKKKEKEKDKERGKDSKKDKKSKKGKKKNQEEDMQVEMSVPKDSNFSASNDAIFETLLQETERTSLENDAGDVDSRPGAVVVSNHASVEVSQGDYLPDYPIQQPLSQDAGDKLVSQGGIINPVTTIGQEQPGENNDILSNSMNFIGLPTLAEENDQQSSKTCLEANTEEKTGKKNYSPMHATDPTKISMDQGGNLTSNDHEGGDDEDDDDHDPEAHAFSPEESLDHETEGMKQSPFQEDPISSSELLSRSGRTESNPSYQVTQQSDHQDEGKSPPPAYPIAVNKSMNKVTSSKQSSLDGRGSSQPFDILSQPWLTQSTTSSSQSLGTVASALPQRTNTSDHSQNQTIMSHGNVRGYPRHHETLAVDSTLPSSHAVTQPPMNVSNLYKPVGSTETQLSRPTFNFYSSANSQKMISETPSKGQSEKTLSETLDLNAAGSVGLSGKTRRPLDASVPQMSGGAPMRALEKPPINKSFTKANIHRTLTSFEKLESEEEKWKAEKEKAKAAKEPPKPPQVKKPAVVAEGEDEGDLVGHRALDKDLVNKFPWLADEDEPKPAGKGTTGKSTRNSTSFSVQSMAQSAAQNYGTRKRQDKTKGAVGLKDPNGGKTNTPPQGDGNSRQLWNPSFSKAMEKSRNDLSTEDVTFIRELKDTQIEKTQPPLRSAKGTPVSDQLLKDISEFGLKGKRKGPHAMSTTAQQSLLKNTADLGSGKGTNQSVQLTLESGLTSPLSTLPAYPSSQSLLQVSEPLGTPYSQYNAALFSSESQSSTKPFISKASSQSAFPKVSSVDSSAPSLNNQERDQANSDIFPGSDSLDFFFGKEHPDLSENMVETLQAEQNSALNKQPSMQAMRNSPFEQVPVSSPYGQLSPMNANINRQLSQVSQRIPTSQTAASRPASQPSAAGVKRPSNQMTMQPGGHVKRHQKDSDIFRGSPSSDGNHMGSPETSTVPYGSPMMPPAAADQQSSSGAVERSFRYQQGVQGFSGHPNMSGMQTSYNMARGEQVPPKKSKTMQGPERNTEIGDVQSWSNQSVSSSIGSRSNPRSSQNASFISEMPSVSSVPSGFSQNEVASNPGNSGLLSSLSPSRHLRPNELPTYLPSLSVRNPILTSPPYPGKGTSTREPDISFDSMFSSSRSNSLPLNVPHNYSVFPDHPTHNTGLSTVKHGHVASHAPNSSGPFNFNNIFNDVTASSSQGHGNPSPALNHSLHPPMHLGNALQSSGEEPLPPLRGGVNQRHRNQQLGNAGMRGLEHLFSQNSGVDGRGTFPMAPMGVPTHPYVPSMPPY